MIVFMISDTLNSGEKRRMERALQGTNFTLVEFQMLLRDAWAEVPISGVALTLCLFLLAYLFRHRIRSWRWIDEIF